MSNLETLLAGPLRMFPRLRVELSGEPASIGRARDAVREFAIACGADPDALALAVSEAVTNAIVHGYRDSAVGAIELRGHRDGADCVVEVIDRGVGMRPHPTAHGLRMGLPVISTLADTVEIASLEPGTAITMRFGIA